MQSTRSINYFRTVLDSALNYFGREQRQIKKQFEILSERQDDFIEIISQDQIENSLENSFDFLQKYFPVKLIRDESIQQNQIRQIYKDFLGKNLKKPKISLDSLRKSINFNSNNCQKISSNISQVEINENSSKS